MAEQKDIEKKLKLLKALRIGRFQVMALLQAARYYLLYRDIEKAKSFGLNRAIFYAWAKYYGPHTARWRNARLEEILRKGVLREKKGKCPEGMVEVLGECVEVSGRGFYVIGGKEQTPADFRVSVEEKINKVIPFEEAWEAAVDYVSKFPEWVLRDQQKFYKLVYEPVRDTFLQELVAGKKPEPSEWLLSKIKSIDEQLKKTRRKQSSLLDYISDK